jgi:hypothetical protein
MVRFALTLAERGKYSAVVANYHDLDSAQRVSVTVGSGEPAYTLRHNYPDQVAAEAAARSKLDAFARGVGQLRATVGGNPNLVAEGRVVVSGVREAANGEWVLARVTHSLGPRGYISEIEGETPK